MAGSYQQIHERKGLGVRNPRDLVTRERHFWTWSDTEWTINVPLLSNNLRSVPAERKLNQNTGVQIAGDEEPKKQ